MPSVDISLHPMGIFCAPPEPPNCQIRQNPFPPGVSHALSLFIPFQSLPIQKTSHVQNLLSTAMFLSYLHLHAFWGSLLGGGISRSSASANLMIRGLMHLMLKQYAVTADTISHYTSLQFVMKSDRHNWAPCLLIIFCGNAHENNHANLWNSLGYLYSSLPVPGMIPTSCVSLPTVLQLICLQQ